MNSAFKKFTGKTVSFGLGITFVPKAAKILFIQEWNY